MHSDDFVIIYSGSIVDINRIKSNLLESGISPIIKSEIESARLAGFGAINGSNHHIYVHKNQIENSNKIIKKLGI